MSTEATPDDLPLSTITMSPGKEPLRAKPEEDADDRHDRTQFVVDWLYQHYEVSVNTSVPRSTVFNDYTTVCKTRNLEPVNPATFGKVIRAVFPELKTRRLGTRGNSKYHYFGIAPAGTTATQLVGEGGMVTTTPGPKRKMRIPVSSEGITKPCAPKEQLKSRPPPPPPLELPYHPLIPDFDEFARFVEQICQPIPEKLGAEVSLDMMQSFAQLYQNHIVHLLRLISAREFNLVEMALGMFWSGLPKALLPGLDTEEGVRIVSIADDYLFQVAIHILVPEVLDPLPLAVAQAIRHFARCMDTWLLQVFDTAIPTIIVDAKLDLARRFCQVLRRRTALNHLSQAVRAILGSPDHLRAMLHDFGQIDFCTIREQIQWVVPGQETFLAYIEVSFKAFLLEGASLPQWTQWLETMTEQCISVELVANVTLEEAARTLMLRWSFLATTIMRDLTLRSASSFGSYHLLRLIFDEYIMHVLEKKLDEHRRAVGLLSYWPAQHDQAGQVTVHTSYETAMAGFASMDELFRKSGLLAYSQPANDCSMPSTPKPGRGNCTVPVTPMKQCS
ncbi:DNA-binding RFX-type winged-helix domain-containing protein [Paramicrosporidium saccamoebae]|uniref:DNA-binding RFX-type winged-helix domain-containing protein n=1 Tax=Paramicrosporidium saccamoebae TaxID=1246581 RepID=A0A2H9TKT4_9FUNG|nr:DNA-binding RFX-type winged-helix domain-containing protein [Paramicrosporidium saccamoebae]